MNHLLCVADLNRDLVDQICQKAEEFTTIADQEVKKVPALRGKTVLTLFYEASTRTRSSFELAAKRLSADVVSFSMNGSSVEKGESFKDTVLTLVAHDPDAIVVRTPYAGSADLVKAWSDAAVINAGDGKHEHPTQSLLDIYTLKQRVGSLEGRTIFIVGDIAHSRVARSNIAAFQMMGASVVVCGPPTLIPADVERLGCSVRYELHQDELASADVVYVLRLQRERMDAKLIPTLHEYARYYQITGKRLRKGQLVMHPGPVNRGVEIAGDVVESAQAAIATQVRAGVVVRMAVLYELLAHRSAVEGKEGK